MKKDISYQGIDWEVGYAWDDEGRTDVYITSVKVPGSDVDLYDHLQQTTLDGLYEALEESFE